MQYRIAVEDILNRPTTYTESQRMRNAYGSGISPNGCAMLLLRAWHRKGRVAPSPKRKWKP